MGLIYLVFSFKETMFGSPLPENGFFQMLGENSLACLLSENAEVLLYNPISISSH